MQLAVNVYFVGNCVIRRIRSQVLEQFSKNREVILILTYEKDGSKISKIW